MKWVLSAVLAAVALLLLPRLNLNPPVEALGDRAGWYVSADQNTLLRLRPGPEPASLTARILFGDVDQAWLDLEGVLYPDELRLKSAPDPKGGRFRLEGRFLPDGNLRFRSPDGAPFLLHRLRVGRDSGPAWDLPRVAWASVEYPLPDDACTPLAAALCRARAEAEEGAWDTFSGMLESFDDEILPRVGALSYEETWSASAPTPDLLSLFGEIRYDLGGAHPNFAYRTKTFWAGNELRLEDLFKPDSGWLVELRRLALIQLFKAGASSIVEGGTVTESELEFWSLSEGALQFSFAPYAMGCYAEGSYFVEIPFDRIAEWLAPEGPLGVFAD